MLLLKLVLVPCALAAASWAGRRWGPAAAGWLAGLPIVGGPILFFLAVERGAQFAAQAAAASLAAVVASLSFGAAYAWGAVRGRWPAALLGGLAAWGAAAALLARLPASVWASLAAALVALIAAPWIFPPQPAQVPARRLPRTELLLRMVAGVALTFLVTLAAARIGPTWSGLLTVFPVLGIVLAVFSHLSSGPAFVVALFRAMAAGLYGFAAFCLCLALTLGPLGLAASMTLSVACALGAQAFALLLRRRPQ